MSLNTSHANGGVLIYAGECIVLYCDNVEFHLKDNNQPEFKGSKKGRIYLTTHRVIFNTKSNSDSLQSFSMPFYSLKGLELEQPVFGANYIKGNVNAEQGGKWQGDAKFTLHFMHGGAIEFGKALLEAGKRASRNYHGPPPPYMPPSGPYYPAQPPAYMPPPQGYGFYIPTQQFPDQPPVNSVYASEQPPPYPGINSTAPYYPPGPPMPTAPAAAATNGYGFNTNPGAAPPPPSAAYYNPDNPQQLYMPPAPPNLTSSGTACDTNSTLPTAPPSYDQATADTKKKV